MRLDTEQALRPVLCLPNPSAMQGARRGGMMFKAGALMNPHSRFTRGLVLK